jgi:hypothetical protein
MREADEREGVCLCVWLLIIVENDDAEMVKDETDPLLVGWEIGK